MKTAATGLRAAMRCNAIRKQMGSGDPTVIGQRLANLTAHAVMTAHAQHPVWSMMDGALPVLGALGGLGAWCGWRHLCLVAQQPTATSPVAIAHAGLGATVAAAALHALVAAPIPADILPGSVLPIMHMGRMQVAISAAEQQVHGQLMTHVPLRAGGTWCVWPHAPAAIAPVVPQVQLDRDVWHGNDPAMRLSIQASMSGPLQVLAHMDIGHEDGPWSIAAWEPTPMPSITA